MVSANGDIGLNTKKCLNCVNAKRSEQTCRVMTAEELDLARSMVEAAIKPRTKKTQLVCIRCVVSLWSLLILCEGC